MSKQCIFLCVLLIVFFGCTPTPVELEQYLSTNPGEAVDTVETDSSQFDQISYTPETAEEGRPFSVAVVQSGEFLEYVDTLNAIIHGLRSLGWLDDRPVTPLLMEQIDADAFEFDYVNMISHNADRDFVETMYTKDDQLYAYLLDPEANVQERTRLLQIQIESGFETVRNIVRRLEIQDLSDYLSFSLENFYDRQWAETITASEYLDIIQGQTGADIMIVLGTLAGKDLTDSRNFSVPAVAAAISDPVVSGVIPSVEDSGHEFLTVQTDPAQYRRQIRLFYDVVEFSDIGVIYADTPSGRSFAAIDDVRTVAEERDFSVSVNHNVLDNPEDDELSRAEDLYIQALRELCESGIDAFYLSIQAGFTTNSFPRILDILLEYDVPSFAQGGSSYVVQGILLGESASDSLLAGLYNAKKMVAILKGAVPRELSQVFEHMPHIALNIATAQEIGFDIPIDIIASADEIFQTME
ncbi:MAG: ABC transporter substrate binding protein [Spirochaetia bacterium]